ncbi:hypothetical protein [Corynebacterium endometrii]|uniref:Uncharacterized protein n=1 Tax=Corynebacterium endometrii TaxID=2488819 RepID=A0A4P7QCZ5_9CORY|nr:hypothetical protein [Corynebacterium endometrii]QCB27442.1 hypothetical protein CENDO_00660 [Corynebacterium endometrii]
MKALFKLIRILFFIFMGLFLIGGVAIIATQTFGIISADGDIVTGVNDWLSPLTFALATACAMCAFVLNYEPGNERSKPAD